MVDLTAQLEDREPEVADRPGHLAAQVPELGLDVVLVGPGSEVVEHVADERELLGDAVVDLPGQPLALLRGRTARADMPGVPLSPLGAVAGRWLLQASAMGPSPASELSQSGR